MKTDDSVMKPIRNYLLLVMGKNKWSLLRLSTECGVSYDTLTAVMYHSKDIKLSTLIDIANGLNVDIGVLISGKEQRKAENEEILLNVYKMLKIQLRKGGIV